jgi:hypothetical protein
MVDLFMDREVEAMELPDEETNVIREVSQQARSGTKAADDWESGAGWDGSAPAAAQDDTWQQEAWDESAGWD